MKRILPMALVLLAGCGTSFNSVEEVTVDVGTPKGLFTGTFPKTAKVEDVITAAVDILLMTRPR